MRTIVIEPTNRCNRSCGHCFRNKADPHSFLPLEIAEAAFSQAEALGFKMVCLTGGEVALYPYLGELLRRITAHGFHFTMVTNGYRFPEYVLPLLLEPEVKRRAASVCFSLDGARAETHDGLRGPKSFREVIEGATLCRNHHLPFSLKSTITTLNRGELTELALLGTRLGTVDQGFLYPFPSPSFIRCGLLPTPEEMEETVHWIQENLIGVMRNKISLDGRSMDGVVLNCGQLVDNINLDYQGNLVFCCTLSHTGLGDGIPTDFGSELLGNLTEISLQEGIARKFHKAAEVVEARLNDGGNPKGLSETPCHWCLKYFGKFGWLQDFPNSPWTEWLIGETTCGPKYSYGKVAPALL